MGKIFEIIAFIVVFSGAVFIAVRAFKKIYRNIFLGRKDNSFEGDSDARWKKMFLVAFGQKKMFKRPVAAMLHLVIYVSFCITQIELIEIVLDGLLGQHRLLYHAFEHTPFLKGLYVFAINLIEFLSIATLIVTIAFLWRRDMLKLPRFKMKEMKGWPNMDAHIILFMELLLITNIFIMNGFDMAAHKGEYGFIISGTLFQSFYGGDYDMLMLASKVGWWGHLFGVLGFLVYLAHSKHLHILLAFPNTYFSRLQPAGYIANMPEVTREVKLMMDPNANVGEAPADAPTKFGAKDIMDLSWKNLLEAYTCTECGRCSAQCPAAQTGKALSPRKIMMDTRDRIEEVSAILDANKGQWVDDHKGLVGEGKITVEELRACTTCNACVEECPVNISPVDIIIQLRRGLIMEDSNSPAEWNGMFANLENNGAPWQFSQQDRLNWVK